MQLAQWIRFYCLIFFLKTEGHLNVGYILTPEVWKYPFKTFYRHQPPIMFSPPKTYSALKPLSFMLTALLFETGGLLGFEMGSFWPQFTWVEIESAIYRDSSGPNTHWKIILELFPYIIIICHNFKWILFIDPKSKFYSSFSNIAEDYYEEEVNFFLNSSCYDWDNFKYHHFLL